MKVKETKKHKVDFATLKPGDCFWWDNTLFVKSNYNQRATGLVGGRSLCDMCGEMVTPINAEVHIID